MPHSSPSTITAELANTLEASFQLSQTVLKGLGSQNFQEIFSQAFGPTFNMAVAERLTASWQSGYFEGLPPLVLQSKAVLGKANAAFSAETNTIYVNEAFLAANVDRPPVVAQVLLEEIGHFIDHQGNLVDALGDEGQLFAHLVSGHAPTAAQIASIQNQDDAIALTIDGQTIVAEAATDPEENLDQLVEAIDDLLAQVKSAIGGQTLGGLPLIGDLPLVDYVDQLLSTSLSDRLQDELDDLEETTAASVRQALFDAMGPGGLNLLLDVTGDSLIDINDIETPSSLDSVEYSFSLGRDFSLSPALSETLGIPGIELALEGGADLDLGLSLDLHFGVDDSMGTNAFFINTGTDSEFKADLALKLVDEDNNPLSFKGSLGFLELIATDNGSQLTGNFEADINGTADGAGRVKVADLSSLGVIDPNTNISGDLHLSLNTGLDVGRGIDNGVLPTILAELNLVGLAFDDDTGVIAPSIGFENVQLDLGTFADSFAGSILRDVQKVTAPFNPIVDVLTDPLPVIKNSLIDLASAIVPGLEETENFLEQLDAILDIVEKIPTFEEGEAALLSLGDFGVGGGLVSQVELPDIPIPDQIDAFSALTDFFNALDESEIPTGDKSGIADDLRFPFLEDPASIIRLLLGDPSVELFNYTTPQLGFNFPINLPSIPVFGPIVIEFGGAVGASAQIKFGFDSKGLADFQDSGFTNPAAIFDGFFASRPSATEPNLELTGEITAGAGVSIGIADLIVGGGIRLTTGLSLFNPADPLEPFKVRGSTIASQSPLCLFETEGALAAFIFAAFELDLGFFSITKRFNLADINLIDFETQTDCEDLDSHFGVKNPEKSPELEAQLAGQGILDRTDTDSANLITVTHISGSKGNETLLLTGLDPDPREYTEVKAVILTGLEGDDIITFIGGVQATGEVKGGDGNDSITTGEGYDFLDGGAGFDTLNGGGGQNSAVYTTAPSRVEVDLSQGRAIRDGYGASDTLINIRNVEGSRFDDRLVAHAAGSVLDGGDGNDRLEGRAGNDVMLGGAGADFMDGQGGEDTVTYIGSRSGVNINISNQFVFIPLSPIDGLPLGLAANSGTGGEADGDQLFNIENLQGSLLNDVLVAGSNGGNIDASAGDDLVLAGQGSEFLGGGTGIDWLSYRLSTGGVNVSLLTGGSLSGSFFSFIGQGGYAQGDRLQIVQDPDGDRESPFEHLEGSNFNDILEGDDRANILKGLAGNDDLYGRGGDDILIGGLGADDLNGGANSATLRANTDAVSGGGDTASYEDAASGVTVNLLTGAGSRGEALGDTLTGIENLKGTRFGDDLIGDNSDNDFQPGLGNGQIDTVNGNGGRDRLTVTEYAQFDTGAALTGGFTNPAAGIGTLNRGSDTINFTNIERLVITGTFQDDSLVGGSDRDVFQMGAGDDFVDGGGGDDDLDGDDGIDTLSDDLSHRTEDIVLISTDPTVESTGTNLSLAGLRIRRFEIFKDIQTGTGNDQLTQLGRIDNLFVTGAGNDRVNTGLGFDIADGGDNPAGVSGDDDLLVVDYSVADTGSGLTSEVTNFDAVNGGRYFRTTSEGEILDEVEFSNFERFDLTGTQQTDLLIGGSRNDRLVGNDGNDVVFALSGNDDIDGGDGDDTLWGGRGDDFIRGGAGNDLIIENLDLNDLITSGGNDVIEGGDGNDTIGAGDGNDQIFGGNDDDTLVGGDGNDNLNGDDGNDILAGVKVSDVSTGPEIDTLTGGLGADQFWLGDENAIYYNDNLFQTAGLENYGFITDFNPEEGDTIQLNGFSTDYFLTTPDFGAGDLTFIYLGNPNFGSATVLIQPELIGIVRSSANLDLDEDYFVYVGGVVIE